MGLIPSSQRREDASLLSSLPAHVRTPSCCGSRGRRTTFGLGRRQEHHRRGQAYPMALERDATPKPTRVGEDLGGCWGDALHGAVCGIPLEPRDFRFGRGDWIRSDPCAQGERTHTTGGSGRPLPLVSLRNFAIWGNCRKPRAATDCQPIVSQQPLEDLSPERSYQPTASDLQSPAISLPVHIGTHRAVFTWVLGNGWRTRGWSRGPRSGSTRRRSKPTRRCAAWCGATRVRRIRNS